MFMIVCFDASSIKPHAAAINWRYLVRERKESSTQSQSLCMHWQRMSTCSSILQVLLALWILRNLPADAVSGHWKMASTVMDPMVYPIEIAHSRSISISPFWLSRLTFSHLNVPRLV